MSTIKRAWLLFVVDDGDDVNDVAKEIWEYTNEGKSVIKAYKDDFPEIENLKLGWVVRADVVNKKKIMVPVVGELKDQPSISDDPITLIADTIGAAHGVKVTRRFVVEEDEHHHPNKGSGNDDPDGIHGLPLNAWG